MLVHIEEKQLKPIQYLNPLHNSPTGLKIGKKDCPNSGIFKVDTCHYNNNNNMKGNQSIVNMQVLQFFVWSLGSNPL